MSSVHNLVYRWLAIYSHAISDHFILLSHVFVGFFIRCTACSFSGFLCFLFFPFACSGVGGVLRVCYTHSNSCLLSEIDWHGGEEREGGNMVVNAGSLILFLSYFIEA